MMKPGSNMQLSKKSLAEELAGRLQGQFMSGKFEVGEKLPPEPELMQIFGVGRSTVREAVRILSNMGFLKVRQGAGTFVERLTPPDEPMERRLGRADLHSSCAAGSVAAKYFCPSNQSPVRLLPSAETVIPPRGDWYLQMYCMVLSVKVKVGIFRGFFSRSYRATARGRSTITFGMLSSVMCLSFCLRYSAGNP